MSHYPPTNNSDQVNRLKNALNKLQNHPNDQISDNYLIVVVPSEWSLELTQPIL